MTHYEACFKGLDPGTEYAYRVGDGTVWSAWNHFRTASAGRDRFRFIYLGDAQSDVRSQWSRVVRTAALRAPDAAFIALGGDLVAEGFDDSLWGQWCDSVGFLGSWIPLVPTPGNHDMNLPPAQASTHLPDSVSPLWRAHFSLPSNGPADAPMLRDEAYYVDYQGMRLISVEGNAFSSEDYDPGARQVVQQKEVAWLEKVLRDNPNRWTVVIHHEPVYKVGNNSDNPELREAFVPLYDKYHVDLVLQGHDHVYARTEKLFHNKVAAASRPGTIYVVSVSGPKMYPFDPQYQPLMAKVLTNTEMFQVIEVNGNRLRFKAFSVSGALVDTFELLKNGGGAIDELSYSTSPNLNAVSH